MPEIINNRNGKWKAAGSVLINAGGIAIGILSLWIIWNIFGLISNHMNENTAALIKLESSVNRSNEVNKEQMEILRDLKSVILQLRNK